MILATAALQCPETPVLPARPSKSETLQLFPSIAACAFPILAFARS